MKPKKPILKYIVGVVIIAAVAIGAVLIVQGKNAQQDASVYKANNIDRPAMATTTVSITPAPTPLNCFPGSTVPKIKVLSPNGGETFAPGQQVTIKWSTCNIPSTANIRLDLNVAPFPPSGTAGVGLANTPNDGQQVVTLPAPLAFNGNPMSLGTNFKVNAWYSNGTATASDLSDNLFTISSANIVPSITTTLTQTLPAVVANPGSNNDAGQFTITFNVTAVGGNAYVPESAVKGLVYAIERAGVGTTVNGVTASFNTVNQALVPTSNGNILIPQGQSVAFHATVTAQLPAAGTAGLYRAQVSAVKWATADLPMPNQTKLISPVYQTAFISLD